MTTECEFVEDCTGAVRTCGADADLVEVAGVEVALCPKHARKIPAGQTSEQHFSGDSMNDRDTTTTGQTTNDEAHTQARTGLTRRAFVQGAGATALITATGAGAATAEETTTDNGPDWTTGRGGLNWSSDYVQNPYYAATLTKSKHKLKWGTDDAALATYENNSGEKDSLGGTVDRDDTMNVVTARADKLDVPDFSLFPRETKFDENGDGDKDTDVSALDPQHWSTTGATNGSVTLEQGDTKVDRSIRISSSNVASGETVKATFDLSAFDAEVTDDVGKRFAQIVARVDAIPTAGNGYLEIAFIDGEGDEKRVYASADRSADDIQTLSTTTGTHVLQERIAELPTAGSGDGTFDEIQSVELRCVDGDCNVTLTALNAERKSKWVFGSYLQNEDTDDEESMERTAPSGEFTITGLDTFSEEFTKEDAVFYDLQYPMRISLGAGDLDHEFRFVEATDRPGYGWVLEQRGKFTLPTGYDLSWASPALKDGVEIPASRFTLVRTATGVKDTKFSDLDESDWNDHTAAYDGSETVSLSDPAQAGVVVAYEAHVLQTDANRDNATDVSASGAGAGGRGRGGSGGGMLKWIVGGFAAISAFIGGTLKGWW